MATQEPVLRASEDWPWFLVPPTGDDMDLRYTGRRTDSNFTGAALYDQLDGSREHRWSTDVPAADTTNWRDFLVEPALPEIGNAQTLQPISQENVATVAQRSLEAVLQSGDFRFGASANAISDAIGLQRPSWEQVGRSRLYHLLKGLTCYRIAYGERFL